MHSNVSLRFLTLHCHLLQSRRAARNPMQAFSRWRTKTEAPRKNQKQPMSVTKSFVDTTEARSTKVTQLLECRSFQKTKQNKNLPGKERKKKKKTSKATLWDLFHSYSGFAFEMTHQKAHEVQGEDSGHSPKGQPLENSAANACRVTVVPGGLIGRRRGGALYTRAALDPQKDCGDHERSVHPSLQHADNL